MLSMEFQNHILILLMIFWRIWLEWRKLFDCSIFHCFFELKILKFFCQQYYSFQKISPDTYVFDSKEDNTGSYREKNTIRLKTRFMRQNPRGLFSYKQRTPGKGQNFFIFLFNFQKKNSKFWKKISDPAYKIANFENYPMSSYLEYGWFGWDIQETEEFIEMPETPAEKAKDASYLGNFFKECLESNTYKRDAFDRLISAQFLMPFKAIDTSEKNYFPLCSRWDVTVCGNLKFF